MAHFWFILLFVALALPRGGGAFSIKGLGFLGFPLGEPYHSADGQGWHGCISEQEAEIFVRRFISILNRGTSDLGNATETAEDIIAEGFTVISNSILSLEGTLVRWTLSQLSYGPQTDCFPADQQRRHRQALQGRMDRRHPPRTVVRRHSHPQGRNLLRSGTVVLGIFENWNRAIS